MRTDSDLQSLSHPELELDGVQHGSHSAVALERPVMLTLPRAIAPVQVAAILPEITPTARPFRTLAAILSTDAAALMACVLVLRVMAGPSLTLATAAIPAVLVFLVSACLGSYGRPGLSASSQTSRLCDALFFGHVMAPFVAVSFLLHPMLLVISGFISATFVLMGRAILHGSTAKRSWYGWPVMVMCEHPDDAARTIRGLLLHPELGLKPVAVLLRQESGPKTIESLPVLSGPETVESLYSRQRVRYGVYLSPGLHKLSLMQVKAASADFVKLTFSRHLAPLIGVHAHQPRVRRCWIKRSADLSLTCVGLLIAMPIMAISALLIRLDTHGPALFLQKRPGREGRPFRIIKFRTMCCHAARQHSQLPEEMKDEFEKFGKIQRDPRVTRIGQILRKTSIDELPQLFNVLKADMSLVGPRPHLMFQRAQLVAHHRASLKARPGLTGLWQISGRSSIPFETRLAMDVYYAQVGDLWLDLYILARTVMVVLGGKGAY